MIESILNRLGVNRSDVTNIKGLIFDQIQGQTLSGQDIGALLHHLNTADLEGIRHIKKNCAEGVCVVSGDPALVIKKFSIND